MEMHIFRGQLARFHDTVFSDVNIDSILDTWMPTMLVSLIMRNLKYWYLSLFDLHNVSGI